MKTKVMLCSLFFTAISVFWACGPSSVDVNGEVFIVTQGGSSIKLSLIEIYAYEAPDMEKFIKSRTDLAKSELDKLAPALKTLLMELKAAYDAHDKFGMLDESKAAKASLRAYWSKKEEYSQVYKKYSPFFSGQFWTMGLPAPIQTIKSDSEGRFVLQLKPGKYGLVASGSRKVMDKEEEYYWLIWTNVVKKPRSKILLSNDNLLDRNSADCAVPFNALPARALSSSDLGMMWINAKYSK